MCMASCSCWKKGCGLSEKDFRLPMFVGVIYHTGNAMRIRKKKLGHPASVRPPLSRISCQRTLEPRYSSRFCFLLTGKCYLGSPGLYVQNLGTALTFLFFLSFFFFLGLVVVNQGRLEKCWPKLLTITQNKRLQIWRFPQSEESKNNRQIAKKARLLSLRALLLPL